MYLYIYIYGHTEVVTDTSSHYILFNQQAGKS